MQTQQPEAATRPTPGKLPLHKETLRRLTPAALRVAAGGTHRITAFSCLCDLEMKRG